MSTYSDVAKLAKAIITAGNRLWMSPINSYSVSVDGVQLGNELSVRQSDISKMTTPIPKIAIQVLDALPAIGIVIM